MATFDIKIAKPIRDKYYNILLGRQYPIDTNNPNCIIRQIIIAPKDLPSEFFQLMEETNFAWENAFYVKPNGYDHKNVTILVISGWMTKDGVKHYSKHFLDDVLDQLDIEKDYL